MRIFLSVATGYNYDTNYLAEVEAFAKKIEAVFPKSAPIIMSREDEQKRWTPANGGFHKLNSLIEEALTRLISSGEFRHEELFYKGFGFLPRIAVLRKYPNKQPEILFWDIDFINYENKSNRPV
jgi:hypothetical protein